MRKAVNLATSNGDTQFFDPFAELNRFLRATHFQEQNVLTSLHGMGYVLECLSLSHWTIQLITSQLKSTEKEFPVIRLMAHDYMAIPASSCLAEHSFSMSARTDDVH